MQHIHDSAWLERYSYARPVDQGKIIIIDNIGDRDYYNPALCIGEQGAVLAIRLEDRQSDFSKPMSYHPQIVFASQIDAQPQTWRMLDQPAPYDMLEDPLCTQIVIDGKSETIFGGVRALRDGANTVVQTELYRGPSVQTLGIQPFAVVHNMKDIRLLQLPDGRFLVCRRPKGAAYGNGRITLHILDNLDQLSQLDTLHLTPMALLDSGYEADWVGTNNVYLLNDQQGQQWIGLLAHLGFRDQEGLHYAATTYKISLESLLDNTVHMIMPRVIATRACFEDGPQKTDDLYDVIFPGSLEHVSGEQYRLWAGLSDARIGSILIDDPFGLTALPALPHATTATL